MCGIFGILNKLITCNDKFIDSQFNSIKHRGPEFSRILYIEDYLYFGFHRLAINGLNDNSNQPLELDKISLICNGEIYNYRQLIHRFNLDVKTNSDCEVILHLYKKFGLESTLKLLDGVFAFAIYDENTKQLHITRDRFGVRPLYITDKTDIPKQKFYFASEAKALINFNDHECQKLHQFEPGTYLTINLDNNGFTYIQKSYYTLVTNTKVDFILENFGYRQEVLYDNIYSAFKNAVVKRIENSDRPVACLLSGGLDSSLVAAMSAEYLQSHNKKLYTFSIGFEDSVDLKFAQDVADHIGSIHQVINVTNEQMVAIIPEVIKQVETYDTTTIRASVPNYLLGKYIKENTDFKVILGGDGADELMGGYLYLHNSPTPIDFNNEVISLLNNIHFFDGKRADRCMAGFGLEIRLPFLDSYFVDTYLSYNLNHRYLYNNKVEKALLRNIIDFYNPNLLPQHVLFRRKEAFSDGVNATHESWFKGLDHLLDTPANDLVLSLMNNKDYGELTFEQTYYNFLFNSYFPNQRQLIPNYWMPKFTDSNDASAKTLENY
jgi:asparagine synthase (glutamine-hydrolysing)